MKQIKQTFRQSLALLVISILSLQAVCASSAAVFPAASSDQAWQDLQNKIASLNATSAPEDLVATEANVVIYQSAVALRRNTNWQGDQQSHALVLVEDLINADYSDSSGVVPFINSVEIGSVQNELLHARVGLVKDVSFTTKFHAENESLLNNVKGDFMAWQKDLINLDMTKPDDMKQLKLNVKVYYQDRNALCNSAHDYQKSELQDAVNAAALTSDEQQLWNHFQSTFTEKCKTACSNYRATPTFAAFPYIVEEFQNVDPKNPACEIQVKMEAQIAINANISAFQLLTQGCHYEFLNVLLAKRNDPDSSLNSFHQLQDKLNQFLNNVDLNNPIAVLEAQVDMLAYEKGIAAAPVISALIPAVK